METDIILSELTGWYWSIKKRGGGGGHWENAYLDSMVWLLIYKQDYPYFGSVPVSVSVR